MLGQLEAMSVLGHKRTFAVQKVMSALPPKADMCSALAHVCFGPIPVIASKYQEFGRSFGSLIARLRASDMGSWMLMLLGGIGFSNHRT
jgi:hypothetical protein